MAEQVRRRRRIGWLWLVAALLCSVATLGPVPAGAQVDALPTPRDPEAAAGAGADAGGPRSNQPPVPSLNAGEGSPVTNDADNLSRAGFVTYRVFATQYQPHTQGAVEVALPDRCVKFASLGNTTALANANCGPGYPLGLDYRVTVARDNNAGVATFPVKEVGPWNLDDNYWNGTSGTLRPRRLFTNLPTGTPEAQAAFYDSYNTVANCKDVDHNPTTRTAGADQFGRCVLNPAGIDLSVAAAAQLGLKPLENAWLTVSFLWEPAASTYQAVTPARILDTRTGTGAPRAPVGPGNQIDVAVTGVGGVPVSGVAAVVLNVTATDVTATESFLTVFPTGAPRPLASSLNMLAGQSVPNLVLARVGAGGKVSIYNNAGTTAVVADVQGWYGAPGAGGRYTPVAPARVLDTRTGTGGTLGKVGGGTSIDLDVRGVGGLPSTVGAVVLNVTATDLDGTDTFVTVYPAGVPRPLASNLNVTGGQSVPNLVVTPTGDGRVTLYSNAGTVHLVADVQGWYAPDAEAAYLSTTPLRLLDTRTGTGGTVGKVQAGTHIDLRVAGAGGVPAGVRGAVLNVTTTDHIGPESYLTVYPAGGGRPLASNLNFVSGQTRANLVFARLGVDGKVSLYNNLGATHVVADLQGWYP
ncbi:MAG TPA: hypothetical protein VM388_10670 [Acidimicrobiales bacterium]|nr:hypothetical protein [Acidimicrobiales bacterium]